MYLHMWKYEKTSIFYNIKELSKGPLNHQKTISKYEKQHLNTQTQVEKE